MRDDRAPWIWIVMLAIGVVAVAIVVVGLLADDDAGDDDGTRGAGTATVVVTEDENDGDVANGEEDTGATDEEPASVVVPEVAGLDFVAAGERAEAVGLIADSYPVEADAARGRVVSQEPASGTEVAPTRRLRLNVSLGTGEQEELRVPDVTGPKAPQARRIAWERGFTTITADRDAPSAEEVDEVILQEPAAGTRAPALTQITLYVGR